MVSIPHGYGYWDGTLVTKATIASVLLGLGMLGLAGWIYAGQGNAAGRVSLVQTVDIGAGRGTGAVVTAVAWSPAGNRIVACDGVGVTGCVVVDPDHPGLKVWRPDLKVATEFGLAAYSPRGNRLFLGPTRGTAPLGVSVWDTKTHTLIGRLPAVLPGGRAASVINDFAISARTGFVGFVSGYARSRRSGSTFVADIYNSKTMRLFKTIRGSGAPNWTLSLSPDGQYYASTFNALDISKTVDGSTQLKMDLWARGTTYPVAASWSPHGRYFGIAYGDLGLVERNVNGILTAVASPWPAPPVFEWITKNGIPVGRPLRPCGEAATGATVMAWRPKHSGQFAIGLLDDEVRICDGTKSRYLTIKTSPGVIALAFSPNGNRVAIGNDQTIKIYKLSSF